MSDATATKKKELYEHRRFVFMTLDPVHIGAGGYRLGRVDNTITREPGTNLPKIPGTSLAGGARSYAAMRYGKPEAAGQHKEWQKRKKEDKDKCPILYTFGTATDGSDSGAGGSRAGSVSIGDAHLLFFPVYSMAGPLWVGTKERVIEAWGKESIGQLPVEPDDRGQTVNSLVWDADKLNFGWLAAAADQERTGRDALNRSQIGGERGYGWGRLLPEFPRDKKTITPGGTCFQDFVFDGDTDTPVLKADSSKARLLAHAIVDNQSATAELEPMMGRITDEEGRFGQAHSEVDICWKPGKNVSNGDRFVIRSKGLWEKIS